MKQQSKGVEVSLPHLDSYRRIVEYEVFRSHVQHPLFLSVDKEAAQQADLLICNEHMTWKSMHRSSQ
jgi:hypothetical protein